MSISRNDLGPLRYSTLSSVDGVIFWSPTEPPTIAPVDTDIGYVVKIADRLDLIAQRFLGSPQLGWVILERNDLRLEPNDLVPGLKIFIPTRESLRQRGIVS